MTEHLDVVIVGAGISGVSAAWHLQDRCPTKSYAILEKRESMGGTWDLFRYPGIRSDSDMYTLGFRFRPWTGRQAIADGKPILEYVKSTAAMYGIDRHIRFHHKVISADWSTAENRWTVHIQSHGTLSALTCEFLFLCSGYYNYDEGYSPRFAGSEDFVGPIIHPQHWPEDLDYDAKNIVVIGSGATAVTLVPALADSGAKHVTMLQRSPTYIVSQPDRDGIAEKLNRWLPETMAYTAVRWKNVLRQAAVYSACQKWPRRMRIPTTNGHVGTSFASVAATAGAGVAVDSCAVCANAAGGFAMVVSTKAASKRPMPAVSAVRCPPTRRCTRGGCDMPIAVIGPPVRSTRAGPSGPPRCHPAATRSPSGPSGAALRACAPRPRRPPTDR